MNFLEAIDARDILIFFGAGVLAGIAFYFVRSRVLTQVESTLQIPSGGAI